VCTDFPSAVTLSLLVLCIATKELKKDAESFWQEWQERRKKKRTV
jgi:hypothetical protein